MLTLPHIPFTAPAAASCANHYSAGRRSNGLYYLKIGGFTFKVSTEPSGIVEKYSRGRLLSVMLSFLSGLLMCLDLWIKNNPTFFRRYT